LGIKLTFSQLRFLSHMQAPKFGLSLCSFYTHNWVKTKKQFSQNERLNYILEKW